MRYFYTTILILFASLAIACGGNTKMPTAPEPAGPPWEQLGPAEREYYETTSICPEATRAAVAISGWDPIIFEDGTENPQQIEPHRYLMAVAPGNTPGHWAIIQFSVLDPEEPARFEAIAVTMGDVQFLIVDYYVLRALRSGEVTLDDTNDTIFAKATGKYFCLFNP